MSLFNADVHFNDGRFSNEKINLRKVLKRVIFVYSWVTSGYATSGDSENC